MKKSNIIVLFSLGVLLFTGCQKKELDITLNQVVDGNLSLTVVNDAGTGIPDLNVKIYEAGSNSTLEEQLTDANGKVTFNNLLMGTYDAVIDEVVIGNMTYTVIQPLQVINGVTKEFKIVPSEYSGSATITIQDSWTSDPIAGIHVVLFNSNDITGSENFQDILDLAVKSGVTDVDGKVEFDNLAFSYYGIMIYEDELTWDFDTYLFSISEKGEKREIIYNYN
jgi:hypothetical protein